MKVLRHLITGLAYKFLCAGWYGSAKFLYFILTRYLSVDRSVWLVYGHCLRERGEVADAAKVYRFARRLPPFDQEANLQLCSLYTAVHDFRRSAKYLTHIYEENPESNTLKLALYLAKLNSEMISQAESFVNDGLAVNTPHEMQNSICVDVTTLLEYLSTQRQVTGIQRVEIEVVRGVLAESANSKQRVHFVMFQAQSECFHFLDHTVLRTLCDEKAIISLDMSRNDMDPKSGTSLASGMQNLHLVSIGYNRNPDFYKCISDLKERAGWTYSGFIHDCIPATDPQYFTPVAVREFKSLCSSICEAADCLLVPTRATARDLKQQLLGNGLGDKPILKIPLANFAHSSISRDQANRFLNLNGLEKNGFVVFVSTIEARKNHMLALRSWSELAHRHDVRDLPKLVFAGKEGWLCDDVIEAIRNPTDATAPALHLQSLSDEEIQILYENALFTIYPSFKEGWGLPVSESLSFGTPVLASDTAAIKEAGGDLVDYSNPNSVTEFTDKAEHLIFDHSYRRQRSKEIAMSYSNRNWGSFVCDLRQAVLDQVSNKAGLEEEMDTTRPSAMPDI